MRIVIDTNVLVSALMNLNSVPGKILMSFFKHKFIILYDNNLLNEYYDVLLREKFGFNFEIVNDLVKHINKNGKYIYALNSEINFTDKSDKKFYEVYKSGKASYLITGNKKHFPKDAGIVTPREFLEKTKIY